MRSRKFTAARRGAKKFVLGPRDRALLAGALMAVKWMTVRDADKADVNRSGRLHDRLVRGLDFPLQEHFDFGCCQLAIRRPK